MLTRAEQWLQIVMQRRAAQVRTWYDLQAPVLNGKPLEVVGEKHRLRPRCERERIVPVHPVLPFSQPDRLVSNRES